jgi:hypothetical protein
MATSTENPDSRQAPAPWWHDTKAVTFITALIAAVVPGTTAIQAYIEKQQSIELGRIWNAAVAKANSVKARGLQYPVEVYRATDDKARPVIASDTFAHQTARWGMNLLPP